MEKYIINSDTLIIIPISKNKSKVIEKDIEYIIEESTLKIVKNSCLYFGSSLEGRIEGTKYLLNYYYKLPIMINEHSKQILFPTLSYKSNDCCWVCLNNIKRYYKDNYNTNVKFNNNKIVNIDSSFASFENQYYRSLKYQELFNKKIENI